MLGLVNYGSGNYQSVCNALDFLLIDYLEIKTAQDMANVSHIILPGVGAFNDCMNRLGDTHLLQDLKREVLENKKLFLGICVGHQILMSLGTEFEEKEGLGFKKIFKSVAGGAPKGTQFLRVEYTNRKGSEVNRWVKMPKQS